MTRSIQCSPYLDRPRRSEEEARRERQRNCRHFWEPIYQPTRITDATPDTPRYEPLRAVCAYCGKAKGE